MVETINNKKNIIILFIIMIFLLFFIYKGFITDNNHYIQEYKNYLISINASNYYFDKINKNNYKSKNKKEVKKEINKELLLKIEAFLKKSVDINNQIIKDLYNINISQKNSINIVINNTIKSLSEINIDNDIINELISNYTISK
jgi:hypothetical protein